MLAEIPGFLISSFALRWGGKKFFLWNWNVHSTFIYIPFLCAINFHPLGKVCFSYFLAATQSDTMSCRGRAELDTQRYFPINDVSKLDCVPLLLHEIQNYIFSTYKFVAHSLCVLARLPKLESYSTLNSSCCHRQQQQQTHCQTCDGGKCSE